MLGDGGREAAEFLGFSGFGDNRSGAAETSLTQAALAPRNRLPTPRRLAPAPETGCSFTSKSGIGRDTLAASFGLCGESVWVWVFGLAGF